MKRTNRGMDAALAATASKRLAASSQVDRGSSEFDGTRINHPSAASIQVMDRMRWPVSSTDPNSPTTGSSVTQLNFDLLAIPRSTGRLYESAS